MSQMHHINIVFTGGTIEKIYDEVQGGIDNKIGRASCRERV